MNSHRGDRRRDRRRGLTATAGGGLALATALLSGSVADASTGTTVTVESTGGGAAGTNAATHLYGRGETLADAIAFADNASNGVKKIVFSSSVTGIPLAHALPAITEPITIDGANRVTIDGGGSTVAAGIFYVNVPAGAAAATILRGLTLTHGVNTDGGAVYARSRLRIDQCTLIDNTATSGAAVAFNPPSAYTSGNGLIVEHSTLSGNTAASAGGAVAAGNDHESLIIDSTITANRSGGSFGGAVAFANQQAAKLVNSTITGNPSTGAVGGVVGLNTEVYIGNSIVAGNTGTTYPDLGASAGSAAFSLIGNGQASTGVTILSNDIAGTTAHPADPDLAPLARNGGPTETMLPNPGSPVIDAAADPVGAGVVVNIDQRGDPRLFDFPFVANVPAGNGTDMGAVELRPTDLIRTLKRGAGNQHITLTVPGTKVCFAPSWPVTVKVAIKRRKGKPKLKLAGTTVRVGHGSQATKHGHHAKFVLKTKSLASGRYTVRTVVTFKKTLKRVKHHHHVTKKVKRSVKTTLRIC